VGNLEDPAPLFVRGQRVLQPPPRAARIPRAYFTAWPSAVGDPTSVNVWMAWSRWRLASAWLLRRFAAS
jgi:hypothetical protein